MLKNKYIVFLLLFALFITVRLIILIKSPYIFHPEELYNGCIAQAIIDSLNLTFFDYQYTHYEGGSLLIGFLLIPIFKVFGCTVLSIKVLGLLFSVATFIIICTLLFKVYGLKTTILGGLFFVFSPPYYLIYDYTAFGQHHENIFFTFLAICLFYNILFARNKSILLILSLGFVCGLSLWHHMAFLLTIFVIFSIWYSTERDVFINKLQFFIPSFLISFSLFIFYNLKFNFRGMQEFNGKLGSGHAFVNLGKLFSLFTRDLPSALQFHEIIYSYIYYFIFCVAFFVVFYKNKTNLKNFILSFGLRKNPIILSKKNWLEIIVILYFCLYTFAFIITDFNFEAEFRYDRLSFHRYVYAYLPFMILTLSIFTFYFNEFFRSEMLRKILYISIIIFVLGVGISGVICTIDFNQDNKVKLKSAAFDHNLLYIYIGAKLYNEIKYFNSLAERTPESYKEYLYFGLGIGLALEGDNDAKKREAIIGTVEDEGYKNFIYIALGAVDGGLKKKSVSQKELLYAKKYYNIFYRLGLLISGKINEGKSFPEMSEYIGYLPDAHQNRVRELIKLLQGSSPARDFLYFLLAKEHNYSADSKFK